MTRPTFSKLAVLLAACALLAAACGSGSADTESADQTEAADAVEGQLTITDVWSRQPAPSQTTAAVYAVVTNTTDADRQIVGVTSSMTDRAELHETVIDDNGVATMQARDDGFTVSAGETLAFEPGGAHVMLRDIDAAAFGESVDVTFEFDDGETIAVQAEVRNDLAGDAMDDMDHDAMDHGDAEGDAMDHSDHDDGNAADHDDHDDHGAETLDIDVALLHQVDDELLAGNFDADTQRAIVGDYITEIEALEPAADSQIAELLTLLQDLDTALQDKDLSAASEAATAAHDLAHALVPHT